jgi:integrase
MLMPNMKTKWIAAHIPKVCVTIDDQRTEWSFEGVEGLVLDCTIGGARIWKVRYRIRRGGHRIERKIKLGMLDPEARRRTGNEEAYLSPGQAKDRADDVLGKVRAGQDPWLEKHEAEFTPKPEAVSFANAYQQWLINPGRKRSLSPRTKEEYERIYRLHIAPHLGNLDIAVLDKRRVVDAVEKIRRATTDPNREQRGLQATKALKLIRSVCGFAVNKRDYISRDPTVGIDLPVPEINPAGKQNRPPTNNELRQLWVEGPAIMTPAETRVLRIALLLGRRISEIAGAQRSDVKLDFGVPHLFIPADRIGNKAKQDDAVPLPPIALGIIKEALAIGRPDDPLFLGAATRWTTSHALTEVRRRWMWPGKLVRLHDSRTLVADHMAAMGVPTELRSRTLHHTGDLRQLVNTTYSGPYDHMDQRLRALELWERRVLEIVEGRMSSGERWTS